MPPGRPVSSVWLNAVVWFILDRKVLPNLWEIARFKFIIIIVIITNFFSSLNGLFNALSLNRAHSLVLGY